jgi:hypothetical protein
MDKGLETLYHKLTNLFHTNTSTSSSSNASSAPEPTTLLPISTFFDRLIPSSTTSATKSSDNARYHRSSRISRQISIKTDDNGFLPQTTPINITKQQQ